MGKKINVAIAGVGNCASALIQGIQYYNSNSSQKDSIGLTSFNLGGYEPGDINFVAAFDIAESKVGKDLSEAIFAPPNNALRIVDVPSFGIKVQKGGVLDGAGSHFSEVVKVSDEFEVNVEKILKDANVDILINYLPVGSKKASHYYAEKCLEAGVCFINAIPVFISSNPEWYNRFGDKNIPCAGDDVMSQVGATVVHKTLAKLWVDRGVSVDETYQLNIGGDMDFYNMLDEDRLEDKRVSKTSAVKAMIPYDIPMRIGPSDYVNFLQNDKVCYIYMKGRFFGKVPIELDLKLRVPDAYNSSGVMIDAIRGAKIAMDRGVSGPLESISAYCFKHPPIQMSYSEAKSNFMDFIGGKRER
ncbi:inositol-3-phosphate synthase [Candidatus Nitrosocosmicus franklandus]|uniref:Inositol-3-phosphate synthase n=1 Tax=Candidatus Nitrosocosmicus franklandianus TaxID=1798806 RepID=A0A484ICE2_9ARCH|nr:inositol-3-phosphate synthase [Candidatus Nitrosocosmicus franklandus]VFJ14995.1 Inositol-3-phosphate synthase [Candidatus Nitrosocosmicus franklandus]